MRLIEGTFLTNLAKYIPMCSHEAALAKEQVLGALYL